MLEFTKHPKGMRGVLEDLPQETLFRVDGLDYTIPATFPAMVGIAYADVETAFGEARAMSWAMRIALGDVGLNALVDAVPSDEDYVKLAIVVVGRIQGLESPVPEPDPVPAAGEVVTPPKARRQSASRKPPVKRQTRSRT